MKIILHNVPNIELVFSKLVNKHFTDFKKALKIAKITKELATIKQSFLDQQKMIFQKYMKVGEDGNFIVEEDHLVPKSTKPEDVKKLNDELNALHGTEIELESLTSPLVLDDEQGLEDITASDILTLDGIVEFNFEDDSPQSTDNPSNDAN